MHVLGDGASPQRHTWPKLYTAVVVATYQYYDDNKDRNDNGNKNK